MVARSAPGRLDVPGPGRRGSAPSARPENGSGAARRPPLPPHAKRPPACFLASLGQLQRSPRARFTFDEKHPALVLLVPSSRPRTVSNSAPRAPASVNPGQRRICQTGPPSRAIACKDHSMPCLPRVRKTGEPSAGPSHPAFSKRIGQTGPWYSRPAPRESRTASSTNRAGDAGPPWPRRRWSDEACRRAGVASGADGLEAAPRAA